MNRTFSKAERRELKKQFLSSGTLETGLEALNYHAVPFSCILEHPDFEVNGSGPSIFFQWCTQNKNRMVELLFHKMLLHLLSVPRLVSLSSTLCGTEKLYQVLLKKGSMFHKELDFFLHCCLDSDKETFLTEVVQDERILARLVQSNFSKKMKPIYQNNAAILETLLNFGLFSISQAFKFQPDFVHELLGRPCLSSTIAASCRSNPDDLQIALSIPGVYEKLDSSAEAEAGWQHALDLLPVFYSICSIPLESFLVPLNKDNVERFLTLHEQTTTLHRLVEFLPLAVENSKLVTSCCSIDNLEMIFTIWKDGNTSVSHGEEEFLYSLLVRAISDDLQAIISFILSSGKVDISMVGELFVSSVVKTQNLNTLKCLTGHAIFPSDPNHIVVKDMLKIIEALPKVRENARFQSQAKNLITKAVTAKKQPQTPEKPLISPKKGKKGKRGKKKNSKPKRVSYVDGPSLPVTVVVSTQVDKQIINEKEEQRKKDAEMDKILSIKQNKPIIVDLISSLPTSDPPLGDSCYQLSTEVTNVNQTLKATKSGDQTKDVKEPTPDHLAEPEIVEPVAAVEEEEEVQEEEEEEEMSDFIGKAWELAISNTALKQWKKMDTKYRELVRTTFVKLAEEGPKCGKVIVCGSARLFEVQSTGGLRVIWEKNIDFSNSKSSGEGTTYTDIIRILGIVKHDAVDSFVKQIADSHERGVSGKIRKSLVAVGIPIDGQPRCYRLKGEKEEIPPEDEEITIFPPAAFDKESFSIEKFYDVTDGLTRHALKDDDGNGDFFRISEKEFEVICSSKGTATILLGRSGTGKTTCALAKMWVTFYNYWDRCTLEEPGEAGRTLGESCHLHQVFVTANSLLRSEVDASFQKKKRVTLRGEKARRLIKNTADMTLPCHLNDDIALNEFPMFVTSRRWVIMVDGSLDTPFFSRKENQELQFEQFMYQPTQETQRKNFSFESLSFIGNEEEEEDEQNNRNEREEGEIKAQQTCVEIDFQYFQDEIWPKIRGTISKKLYPCSLVWKEIYSYIKGSIDVLHTGRNFLSREKYVALGNKLAPNFTGDRTVVYDLFESYQKYILKMRHRVKLFDWTDVIQHCIQQLLIKPYSGIPIHDFLYDEVQDATQIELYLNFLIVNNPNRFFFTGDTCQTIARGVGFRFEDLRSIFHHYKKDAIKAGSYNVNIEIPKIQQLLLNYRSHCGITSLAAAIVELLKYFFPASFDSMDPDEGILSGPLPQVLRDDDVKCLYTMLGGGEENENVIELGANQVIIVRDQEAKESVPQILRQAGLVMTVFECKGLEFNDVLVYNFFTDSPYDKEWKFVKKYKSQAKPSSSNETSSASSSFSLAEEKIYKQNIKEECTEFRSLCDELKYLYVVTTRAKGNLWFFDSESCDTMNPIQDFFLQRNLVESMDGKNAFGSNFSTPAEWETTAENLMNKKIWDGAALCYKRAGNLKKYHHAMGQHFRQTGITIRNEFAHDKGKMRQSKEKFVEAGKRFLQSEHYHDAALCFYTADQTDFAIQSLKMGNNYEDLSKLYHTLNRYEECADSLLHFGAIKTAVKVLKDGACYSSLGRLLIRAQAVNNMAWADIIKMLIPSFDIQEKVLRLYMNNKDLVNAILPQMPSRFVKQLIRSSRDNPSLYSSLECVLDNERMNSYKKEFCDYHIAAKNFPKALEIAAVMSAKEYYEILRGLLMTNLISSKDEKERKLMYEHVEPMMMKKDLEEQWRFHLGIAFVHWLKDHAKDPLYALHLNPHSIRNCGPMGICDYFALRPEVAPNYQLLTQLRFIRKLCKNYLPDLLETETSGFKPSFAGTLQMMEEYWMIQRHSSGYNINILSPLYSTFSSYSSTRTSANSFTIPSSPVLIIMIQQLIKALFFLKKEVEVPLRAGYLFFKDKDYNQMVYDSFHYKCLQEYFEIFDCLDKFQKNLRKRRMVGYLIPEGDWKRIALPNDLKFSLLRALQDMYYPPPIPDYWTARNEQKDFLLSKVDFLINEERNYRITATSDYFKMLSYNREYFLCHVPSKEKEKSLTPKYCDNVKGADLLAAEMWWHSWRVSDSFSRALLPLQSSTQFDTILNVLEIHVMRYLRFIPDASNGIYVSRCHFIKHFQHSDDPMVTAKAYMDCGNEEEEDDDFKSEEEVIEFLNEERDRALMALIRVLRSLIDRSQRLFGNHNRIGILLAILFVHTWEARLERSFRSLQKKFPVKILVSQPYSREVIDLLTEIHSSGTKILQSASIRRLLDRAVFGMERRRLVRVTEKPSKNDPNQMVWADSEYITLEQQRDNAWVRRTRRKKEAKILLANFFTHYLRQKKILQKTFAIGDPNCPICGGLFSAFVEEKLAEEEMEEMDAVLLGDDDVSQDDEEFDHNQCNLNPKGEIRMIYHQITVGLRRQMKKELNMPDDEVERELEEINTFIGSKYSGKGRATKKDVEEFKKLNEEVRKEITQEDVAKPEMMNLEFNLDQ